MAYTKRRYGLGIWWLGLGYYLFYTPYSALTKALSNGLFPGMGAPVPGTVLLPVSVMATMLGILGFITVKGWWKYAGHRRLFGLSIPFPHRLTFLSGVCIATIMGTTTIAFTFQGISIVLVLVLLRGGVLIIAPIVDSIFNRRVRWFSWAAMWTSLMAVVVVLSDATNYRMSLGAIVNVAAYLTAYFFRFKIMSKMAKSDERQTTLRYFVEEQMIASPLLLGALGIMAAIGAGNEMMGFRLGFTAFLGSKAAVLAMLIGLCYAGLCVCTTLIFLDCRENTFCVPMHCGSSMLSGLTASLALTLFFNQDAPSAAQLVSGGLIVIALIFLSPLHHFQRYLGKLKHSLASVYQRLQSLLPRPGKGEPVTSGGIPPLLADNAAGALQRMSAQGNVKPLPKLFLFVCSGNTCRSPLAAAIGNAEIASRLRMPFEALGSAPWRAISAGISARVGAPMTQEAQRALRLLNIPVVPHKARKLTVELSRQVDRIFCMTQAHRNEVIKMIPSAAEKTHCLDPEDDIEDPIGSGLEAYVKCAQRIHSLVQLRLSEIGLHG